MAEERQQDLISPTPAAIGAAIDSATSIASLVPLTADTSRQAVPSIRGTVYQAWQSIDAWLRLTDDSTAIYLEGAEDFDIVHQAGAVTVQVRNTGQSLSLNTRKALQALEAFWNVSCNEPHRRIELHYLTTSATAHEVDADFSGLSGIDAWRVAQTDAEMARKIASYLTDKLGESSPLRLFLSRSTPAIVQERLIGRFHWFMSQPGLESVKRSVDDRIVLLLATQKRPLNLVTPIRRALESHFWEVIVRPQTAERCLTRADLLRQITESTHTYLPVPLEQLPALLSVVYPGLGLIRLLLQKVPPPPSPLLERPALTERLRHVIQQRKAVLITGTVNKGKTTLAQVAAASLCRDAWWLNVTGRQLIELDNLLLALAQHMEEGAAPNLIILDDLDISDSAYRTYRSSLALVLHRAHTSGRGVLLTAQGGTQETSVVREFEGVELLEVHVLDDQELNDQCRAFGCPPHLTEMWTAFVFASTGGHPKLVQVRLEELRAQGWRVRETEDLLGASRAVLSERQIARKLLGQTVEPPVAELVYIISECSIPLHRSVAIRIAESLPDLRNAGDVLDGLAGKWLERVEPNELRATALLHGVVSEVWSAEKRRQVHALLHDALRSKTPVTPSEAAATLFHAYVAQEPRRISLAALGLQLIDEREAVNQVNRNLQWLSWLALEPGQCIAPDPHTAAILRSMQFRVATTLESDSLTRICERWAEEIERIEDDEFKLVSRAMRWLSMGISTQPIALKLRLEAVTGASKVPSELRRNSRLPEDIAGPLAHEVTVEQAMFSCAVRSVRKYEALEELVTWLDQSANDTLRLEFEAVLEWPVVQAMGAFVHSAWTAQHEETTDWDPWLALFQRVETYARQHESQRFGREAAKARAIVLTEYLDRASEAIDVLDRATESFGESPVLQEQRANTLFHAKDDVAVLRVWHELLENDKNGIALSAFAYRRAAISAARLERWSEAEQLFAAGSNATSPLSTEPTRFGLRADAALMRASSGDLAGAARMLVDALDILPEKAAEEGELRWEAELRVTSEICRFIESRALGGTGEKGKTEPGWASSPDLKVAQAQPGQPARALLIQAEVRRLAACICISGPDSSAQLSALVTRPYLGVRWLTAEGQLALAYDTGAGPDFIKVLLTFERIVINDGIARVRGVGILEPDPVTDVSPPPQPERLASLLVAGVICAGARLVEQLVNWEEASSRILGSTAPLSGLIRSLLDGARQPDDRLEPTVRNHSDDYVRIGAAARLLTDPPSAQLALQLQLLLISGMANEAGIQFQKIWNIHVANQFARTWRELAGNGFQFIAPRSSIPNLVSAIDALETGSGSLGRLMAAAQGGLRGPPAPFLSRIR
jgi:hypothetical protein